MILRERLYSSQAGLESRRFEVLSIGRRRTNCRIKIHMPEVSDGDVEVLFTKINSKKNEVVNGFAEYKNGELTIKR